MVGAFFSAPWRRWETPVAYMQAQPLLDAVVVGAGISGLCCAHALQRRGLSVLTLEAAPRAGGVVHSVERDGFLYELGPNSLLDSTAAVAELVAALGLGARQRWASEAAARRYVLHDGVPLALPSSASGFLRTPLLTARAKWRLLCEPMVARAPAALDESVADFVRRRLGAEVLDQLVEPFIAGIYAGDPEQLSLRAALPRLHAFEQDSGSLARGLLRHASAAASERERQGAVAPKRTHTRSFSFDRGLQVLIDALAAAAGPVALDTQVTHVEINDGPTFTVWARHQGRPLHWRCRTLVLALPADAAAGLLRCHVPAAAAALDDIVYAPLASVASAYARADIAHALDGFGCLVPRLAQRALLGVLFSSSMFEGRAPPGQVLLTSFVGGQRQPELAALSESEIAWQVHAEHRAMLGVRMPPRWQVVTRWPRAIPQYTRGHLARVEQALGAQQKLPGLFMGANWLGGVAMGDCVHSAQRVAEAVRAYLHTAPHAASALYRHAG